MALASEWELVGRLAFSALLGSAIGYERERLAWVAGLRTHMLVCVGSTLIMIVSAYGFSEVLSERVTLDPSRMAAQVVSGIGFLGAGAILARGEIVRGLTTAASVWSVAGIGLAVGGGLYTPAVAATVIILIILAGIKPLEKRFIGSRQRRELLITAERDALSLDKLHEALGAGTTRVQQFVIRQKDGSPQLDDIVITFARVTPMQFLALQKRLIAVPGVVKLKDPDADPDALQP
ncbi:MgtC/SapB family protein [Janthinobacterium sp.]|uniref:MgtC/SapB family protein n=1 Tax=Janthinobacterium sp. TaxID=1871054 RepID=UPI00289A3CBE|nr:MgtC/SapB family protein [Janthinobacterium sp.]